MVFQYDDTFEGLMTAVFEAYVRKPAPSAIVGRQHQRILGAYYETIPTDGQKAGRVVEGVRQRVGADAYERIWTGFLSCDPEKGTVIYRYIRLAMKLGAAVRRHITDERVIAMEKLASLVSKESYQLIEFVRFSRMEGGVYYAKIAPENDVVSLMMPFFAERFNTQPFLIHDTNNRIAGVYDTRDWVLVSAEDLQLPDYASDEKEYRRLWKRFYDTVAIRERINPKLRRQHMPRRFWRNMTEMTEPDAAPATPLPSDVSLAAAKKSLSAQTAFDTDGGKADHPC